MDFNNLGTWHGIAHSPEWLEANCIICVLLNFIKKLSVSVEAWYVLQINFLVLLNML